MPLYAFWRFDDFSWGKTRMCGPEADRTTFITEEERLALEPIPLRRWKDWMRDNFSRFNQESLEMKSDVPAPEVPFTNIIQTCSQDGNEVFTKSDDDRPAKQASAPAPNRVISLETDDSL
ncbi:hypothetical protein FBU59_004045 [Linderina macrospora]|uniref:Uncharacterized protein n=1 Tax=Linderina macrospora TaxID=4868 RepID=A0ACC1J6W1_9FUNG|nr:hypothetical protein FBU59_004045 [Linderina macrospora]